MEKLLRGNVIFIDDGDGFTDEEFLADEAGKYYQAEDVDREMVEMIEKLANLVTGAPPAIQTEFCKVVEQYFPEAGAILAAQFSVLLKARMAEKALRFHERYGVVGKLGDRYK